MLDDLERHGHHEVALLDRPDVDALLAVSDPIVATAPPLGFSDHDLTPARRQDLHSALRRLTEGPVLDLLPGHRVVSASLVVKQPGGGDLDWHLDPSITDERLWRSLSCWIPLTSVGADNGSLEVLSGGHGGAPLDRGGLGTLARTHPDPQRSLASCRAAGGRPSGPLGLPAGWACVYDHRLAHRSGPNRSDRPRVAVNVGLVPWDAPLLIHIWDTPDRVRAVEVADDYFATADLDAPPARRDAPDR